MTRASWTAALLCAAIVFLVGCNRSSIGAGSARLSVDGQVQLDTPHQLLQLTSGKHTVHHGDLVRVLSGTAELERPDGGTIELRRGSELQFEDRPSLLAGSAMAVAGDAPVVIEAAGSSMSLEHGAARITRTLAVSAATYKGSLTINSYGRTLTVPALREASVAAAGVVPVRPSPISYSADDSWDRRYLGVAIELDDQLEARSEGMTASLHTGEGHSVGFYRTVLPTLSHEGQFDQAILQPSRAAGETLVGATLVELGRQGTFAERWAHAFAFRDEGASWGLVALDQGVSDVAKVTGNLDAAIGRAPLLLAAPAAPAAPPIVAIETPPPVTKPAPTPAPTVPPSTTPPSAVAAVPPVTLPAVPALVLPTPTTGTPLDALLDPLTETVNKLLGVL